MLAMDENDDVAKDMLVEKSTAYLSCLLNDVHFLKNSAKYTNIRPLSGTFR